MTAPAPRGRRGDRAGTRRPKQGTADSRIRADVLLANGAGQRRYFGEWNEVSAWLDSPGFLRASPAITSVRLINLMPGQPGPEAA